MILVASKNGVKWHIAIRIAIDPLRGGRCMTTACNRRFPNWQIASKRPLLHDRCDQCAAAARAAELRNPPL